MEGLANYQSGDESDSDKSEDMAQSIRKGDDKRSDTLASEYEAFTNAIIGTAGEKSPGDDQSHKNGESGAEESDSSAESSEDEENDEDNSSHSSGSYSKHDSSEEAEESEEEEEHGSSAGETEGSSEEEEEVTGRAASAETEKHKMRSPPKRRATDEDVITNRFRSRSPEDKKAKMDRDGESKDRHHKESRHERRRERHSEGRHSSDRHHHKESSHGHGRSERDGRHERGHESSTHRSSHRRGSDSRRRRSRSRDDKRRRRRKSSRDEKRHERRRSKSRERKDSHLKHSDKRGESGRRSGRHERKRHDSSSKRRNRGKRRSRSRNRSSKDSRRRSREQRRSRSPVAKKKNAREKMKEQLLQAQANQPGGNLEVLKKHLAAGGQIADPKVLLLTGSITTNMKTGEKITPQEAVRQQMEAMQQKAQELTGIAVPKYYNPAAVNPLKYAEQVTKRKLLWSKKPEEKKDPQQAALWQATSFGQEKQDEKFRKLMGVKEGEAGQVNTDLTSEQIRKQQELFNQLDKEYMMARMTTHTHRGMGLGVLSFNPSAPQAGSSAPAATAPATQAPP